MFEIFSIISILKAIDIFGLSGSLELHKYRSEKIFHKYFFDFSEKIFKNSFLFSKKSKRYILKKYILDFVRKYFLKILFFRFFEKIYRNIEKILKDFFFNFDQN